jgi:hypothetical protein
LVLTIAKFWLPRTHVFVHGVVFLPMSNNEIKPVS